MKSQTISMALVLFLVLGWSTQSSIGQDKKDPPKKDDPLTEPRIEQVPEIVHGDPDNQEKILGKYLKPGTKEVSIVLTSPVEKTQWRQLTPDEKVKAGQTYLALPGCRGDLQLDGVKLTLCGILPEIMPFPSLLESMIDLHRHDKLAVDLTIRRGRVVLTSELDKALVRIRFENTNLPDHGEIIDLFLQGKGTQVLIDRGGSLRSGRHFYPNPKDDNREPPGGFVGIWVLKGHAAFRYGNVGYSLAGPPGRTKIVWSSLIGLKMPETIEELPAKIAVHLPVPDGLDKHKQKQLDEALKACADLAREPADKTIAARLAEASRSREVGPRIMAGRCYAAIGAVPELLERLIEERDADGWLAAHASVKHWMAASRDNEYRLFDAARKRYPDPQARRIMELLHGGASLDIMVEFLDNSNLIVRQLAHYNLCEVVPAGKKIRYEPTMAAAQRSAAQKEWQKLLKTR